MSNQLFYATFAGDAYYNMAMDEWLLSQVLDRQGAVVARLYSWKRGAITIGLNQDVNRAVDCYQLGETPLIRRITGGRALYHDPSELTYAIAVNQRNLQNKSLVGNISVTGLAIAESLSAFLAELGIPAQIVRHSSPEFSSPRNFQAQPCFQSTARFEILNGEEKIVGSAQRRIGNAYLQHGSIKIGGKAVHPGLEPDSENTFKANVLQRIMPEAFESASTLFLKSFNRILSLSLTPMNLSAEESQTLQKRAESVRKNHLSRRIPIEQNQFANSL